MRKILLATTAIAGVGLMAGQALAQAPAISSTGGPLRLGIGGYFQFYGVAASGTVSGVAPGTPGSLGGVENHKVNFDIKTEGEVWFTGETKFDNGLIVGAQVELEASTSGDQIDERYIWFSGDWGRIIAGSTNSAPYKLAVGAPAIDANYDGQDPNYRLQAGQNSFAGGNTGHPRLIGSAAAQEISQRIVDISADSEKITYLSPRFFNLRFGASYTPTNTEEASAGQAGAKLGTFAGLSPNNCNPANATIPTQVASATGALSAGTLIGNPCTFPAWNNLVAAAVNHEGTYGPVFLQAYGGFEYGQLVEIPNPALAGLFSDRESYGAGFDAGLFGAHVGFDYLFDNNGSHLEMQNTWATGATYTMGPLTVGASYMDSRAHRALYSPGVTTTALAASTGGAVAQVPTTGVTALVPASAERVNRILVGARYDLAPGVDLRLAYHYYQVRDCTTCTLATDGGPGAHTNFLNVVTFGTVVRW
jgi:outer membrane protein OmpU